jgi:hypothetical protein
MLESSTPVVRMMALIAALVVLFFAVMYSFFSSKILLPGIMSETSVLDEDTSQ